MYKTIVQAHVDTLDNVNWMDQKTQERAIEKVGRSGGYRKTTLKVYKMMISIKLLGSE